jgi:hypothetical protein
VPRTIVNRYWQKLFGRGLVEPVDDMDSRPWDPDLLDWWHPIFRRTATTFTISFGNC